MITLVQFEFRNGILVPLFSQSIMTKEQNDNR